MRKKKTKLLSSYSDNEDLVQEREELMVFPSQNRVSPPPHTQTSNTKQRKITKLSLSSSSSPAATEDLVEEREDFMVSPSSVKTHLLKPFFTTSTDLKVLSLSVSFNGWRLPTVKFKSWATNMSVLYEPIWEKAGILEAVAASTIRICKDSDLVMGLAERWCPDTKTFVFPWGEATITLEDVMVLLGFSVLGSPVFAALDSSGEKLLRELEKEWAKIKKDKGSFVIQVAWMGRFMDCGDELEHVAFLVLWLSYFVFSSRYYHIDEGLLRIAVHLSSGVKIALAPAVLAHLYADLTLLQDHIRSKSIDKVELNALFKLVQVWTWERFKELQPKANLLVEGQPRLARWDEVEHGDIDVRQVLDNSKSFEWRPYTKAVKNWELPKFYPEREMCVSVGPDLDEELISFARCIKVSELVGIDCVEYYFPNRVASQFGLLQDVPCDHVNRNNLSKKEAWTEYNKPIEDLTLFIPSRSATIPCVTSVFCDWWKKSYPQLQRSLKDKAAAVVESSETLRSRNIIGGDCDDTSASGSRKRKCRKRVCTMGHCEAHDDGEEDLSLTVAQIKRLGIKNCSGVTYVGEDASEPLSKKSRFENDPDPHQELGSVRADGNETVPPPEIEQRNETDILVSSQPETRQTCDEEIDVLGSNVEKMTMTDDGNKEQECLPHGDGGMAGEKASSEKKDDDDDSLIQKKVSSNADNNEPTTSQNLASGGSEIPVGDETQGHDCLVHHDTVLGSEETMKSSEQLETVGDGNDSYKKSLQNVKVMALSIEERIIKLQRNVAWLKARKDTKQRAARLI